MAERDSVILVVDDDVLSFQLMKRVFKKAQILNELYYMDNSDSALDFLFKRGEYVDAPTPDLIYLDLHLPKKKGTEILEIMQDDEVLKTIPTLMLTGSQDFRDIDLANECGAVGYVVKPLDNAAIFETYKLNPKVKLRFVIED